MTADDEGDDSSRLLSRQGPDLQDGGASSETRDHIFASGGENPVYSRSFLQRSEPAAPHQADPWRVQPAVRRRQAE